MAPVRRCGTASLIAAAALALGPSSGAAATAGVGDPLGPVGSLLQPLLSPPPGSAVPAPPPTPATRPLPPEAPAPAPAARSAWSRRLSNYRTVSRWAFVRRVVSARARPGAGRILDRLRTYTADGTPELLLLVSELRSANGAVWVRARLPVRPNGTTGWLPRSALGDFHVVTTMLRVDRVRLRATLFRAGRTIWSAPVGIGTRSAPTPPGLFYIRERLVPRAGNTIYGVLALGTSAYSPTLTDWPGGGVVGIHGTNQPSLIPGRVSHGCVRLRNDAVLRLASLLPLGTPLRIV